MKRREDRRKARESERALPMDRRTQERTTLLLYKFLEAEKDREVRVRPGKEQRRGRAWATQPETVLDCTVDDGLTDGHGDGGTVQTT